MKGIGVSPGISIGRAYVIRKKEVAPTGILLQDEKDIGMEMEKYDQAVSASIAEIERILANKKLSLRPESTAILETQIEFLSDPQIRDNVVARIKTDKKNVNDALIEVIRETVELFKNLPDEYLSARSSDIQDIGNRILKHLNAAVQTDLPRFEPDTILFAEDITPSDTITMDTTHIIGFVTQTGGKTSHAAIVARSRGIPAVAGWGGQLSTIKDNDWIILDGLSGLVLINPDPGVLAEYQQKKNLLVQQADQLTGLSNTAARTTDGEVIKLMANITQADDLDQVFEKGGEGVGLLRTELLFMGRSSFPTEEEQFEFYKKIAVKAGSRPVTVRTLDIGGDKQLTYFNLPAELNPFLGYRAIRICLDRPELFITQLKAILRAGVFGNFKIMFPMIGNLGELRAAKSLLAQARIELGHEGKIFADNIPTGIMIEIPAAALTADLLAKEADFFSIGTNDLCQYTLAVDRMNENVKDLYDPFDPGLLRLIRYTIEQGYKYNIPVSLCGEMASDPLATLLLLGLGLKEFSMSAPSIPYIKFNINHYNIHKAKEVTEQVMGMDNSRDITAYLLEVNQ